MPNISLTRKISPLITIASQSVSLAYVCIKMDTRLPDTGQNTDARNQTGNVAASVNRPVHQLNTAGPCTFLQMIIQGYLTYRQGILKHAKRNIIGRRQAPLYEDVVLPPLRHHDVTAS